MGELVLKNVRTYYNGRDLTGDINSATLTQAAELLDRTAFGSSGRKRRAGLRDVTVSVAGFWDASTRMVDETIWPKVGSTEGIMTMLPQGTGLGNVSYATKGIVGEYVPGGNIGELVGFSFAGHGTYDLVRGKVVRSGWASTKGSTAQTLTAVTTNRAAFLSIQCLKSSGVAGASIKLKITRSTDSGFTSKTTAFTQALTTANVGQAFFATTKISSSKVWYYRAGTSQAGTSAKRLNVVVSVAQQ